MSAFGREAHVNYIEKVPSMNQIRYLDLGLCSLQGSEK